MIQLWELKGRNDTRYSLYSWRTRMALKHKGLEFSTHPVLMSDKPAIAFSGGKTVPILKEGDTVVRDSWKIAEFLEERYPQAPLFGGAIGHGLTHQFNVWADRVLLPTMLPVVVADIYDTVDPGDQAYFRTNFEKFVGKTLEEARAARPEAQKRVDRTLEPLQATLKRQPWVCGAAPAYGDYVLFSHFQWARKAGREDLLAAGTPLADWEGRMRTLFDGFAR